MLRMFKRIWWVPSGSANEKDVPNTLEKWKIKYVKKAVLDLETDRVTGYLFEFNCIPGEYSILKGLLSGGNNYSPIEVLLQK